MKTRIIVRPILYHHPPPHVMTTRQAFVDRMIHGEYNFVRGTGKVSLLGTRGRPAGGKETIRRLQRVLSARAPRCKDLRWRFKGWRRHASGLVIIRTRAGGQWDAEYCSICGKEGNHEQRRQGTTKDGQSGNSGSVRAGTARRAFGIRSGL